MSKLLRQKRLIKSISILFVIVLGIIFRPFAHTHAQEVTALPVNSVEIIEPYSRPAYIYKVTAFENAICVYIDDVAIWQPGDYEPELYFRLSTNFSMVVDNFRVMKVDDFKLSHGFLISLFPVPMYDENENLIGTRDGVNQGCFSTDDFLPGIHIATISLGNLTSEQYTWLFRIGTVSSGTLATAIAMPTVTPVASPRSISVTIEENLGQFSSLDTSLIHADALVGEGREKVTITLDESINITCAASYDKEVTIDDVKLNVDNNLVFFGDSYGNCFISFDLYRIAVGKHNVILKMTSKTVGQYEKSWNLTIENSASVTPTPTP
jgi:hypothetical protein